MNDETETRTEAGEHRLVHHFIRTHGRRPTVTELARLRGAADAPPGHARGDDPGSLRLLRAVRREVARLVHRL